MKISGYAAVFNTLSEDLGGFVEKIQHGAFTNVLRRKPDVKLLYNHDQNHLLARTTSGTLVLEERPLGLWFEADLPNTATGKEVYELISRGDLSQCSFWFAVAQNGDRWSFVDGVQTRTIHEVAILKDVSTVVFPAYLSASVVARGKATPRLRIVEPLDPWEHSLTKDEELHAELIRLKAS